MDGSSTMETRIRCIIVVSSPPTDGVMSRSVPSHGSTGPDNRVLLVDGIDGSGKSRFAELLVRRIGDSGVPVTLLHVDDYRRSVEWGAASDEALIYWDDYFDLSAVESAAGELIRAGKLLVLEGVFTLRLQSLSHCPLVYLEVDYALAAER